MINIKRSNSNIAWKHFFLFSFSALLVFFLIAPIARSQSTSIENINEFTNGIETEGSWSAIVKDGYVSISFKKDGGLISYGSIKVSLSELENLPGEKSGNFVLTREAGAMNFTGKFEGSKGTGQYKFTVNKDYHNYMHNENVDIADERYQMAFFLVNIKRSYIRMLKDNGYTELYKDNLIPLAALDVNEAYIKSIKGTGLTIISLSDFIPLRALRIDSSYINKIQRAGYTNLSSQKIISFKAQGIFGNN